MTHHLSITQNKSKYSAGFYPTFAIDGLALERWLPAQNPAAEYHLVSAHSGLYSDHETELIWDRIYSTAPGWQTLIPMLVCSDDLDLSCTVIVVEQHAQTEQIVWQRFGLLMEPITDEAPTVEWFEGISAATFERANFVGALDAFRQVANVKMDWD